MNPAWRIQRGDGPVVAVALHHGHDLRPEVAERIALDDQTRRREEDAFTERFTEVAETRVVVDRSRFELDLNRPEEDTVFTSPDFDQDLEVWDGPVPDQIVRDSHALHRAFYEELHELLREIEARYGNFVVLDLHSYNHRRGGPDAPPDDPAKNPEVNIGTRSMDRGRWGVLVDRFMNELAEAGNLDVRENVKFKGRYLAAFVHENFPETGCCPAIEFKKTYVDEWTNEPDEDRLSHLVTALRSTIHGLETSLKELA